MKKLIFLLLTFVPLIAFSQKAKIEFDKTSHNFGTISENGGPAIYDFKFTNTGTVPLILTNVRAGCGCTTPEWDRKPVAPGASGLIKVSYNPMGRPGSFIKSIAVNSNASNSVETLTIRGKVTRKPADPYEAYKYSAGPVRFVTNNIYLGAVHNNDVAEKEIEFVNTSDKAATISVVAPAKHITATLTPSTIEKGQKGKLHIKYSTAQKNDWGFVSDQLELKINDAIQGQIAVTATINEDFSNYTPEMLEKAPVIQFSEPEATVDMVKNTTQTHEFFIQNTGKSDLIIRKLKPSDETISITTAKSTIKAGKKTKAIVTIRTDEHEGKKIKIVQFTTNDPKNPVSIYKININVK